MQATWILVGFPSGREKVMMQDVVGQVCYSLVSSVASPFWQSFPCPRDAITKGPETIDPIGQEMTDPSQFMPHMIKMQPCTTEYFRIWSFRHSYFYNMWHQKSKDTPVTVHIISLFPQSGEISKIRNNDNQWLVIFTFYLFYLFFTLKINIWQIQENIK